MQRQGATNLGPGQREARPAEDLAVCRIRDGSARRQTDNRQGQGVVAVNTYNPDRGQYDRTSLVHCRRRSVKPQRRQLVCLSRGERQLRVAVSIITQNKVGSIITSRKLNRYGRAANAIANRQGVKMRVISEAGFIRVRNSGKINNVAVAKIRNRSGKLVRTIGAIEHQHADAIETGAHVRRAAICERAAINDGVAVEDVAADIDFAAVVYNDRAHKIIDGAAYDQRAGVGRLQCSGIDHRGVVDG